MIKMLPLLLVVCIPALSEPIRFATVEGQVEFGHEKLKPAQSGMELKDGDTVQTGKDGVAVLAYPGGTKLKLKESTKMTVHAEAGVDLVMGAVFAHVQKKSVPHFSITTPVAVAGVRGTDFFTAYGSGSSHDNGWLCVKDGEVEVKSETSKEPVVVKAGFGIVIHPREKIAAPKKYDWTEKLNWNMDPGAGELRDKTSFESHSEGY